MGWYNIVFAGGMLSRGMLVVIHVIVGFLFEFVM